jgi:uncharacterized damage-inducible protein DinB
MGELVWSEHETLLYYLGKMRKAVVRTMDGLGEEDVRQPGVPSGTNLLGIVYHLVGVEAHWFRRVFLGEDVDPDMSMDAPPAMAKDDVVAAYRAECARSDEIIRACPDLGTLAATNNPGEGELVALRIIAAHMIEETARHAGHADILREQLDGVTND